MIEDTKISKRHIDDLQRDIEAIKPSFEYENEMQRPYIAAMKHSGSILPSNPMSSVQAMFDVEVLHSLGKQLEKAKIEIFEAAKTERKRLTEEWFENPRLCNESLLGPLGMRSNDLPKEVPLTNALAWLITPQRNGSAFHAEMLAATLKTILTSEPNIAMTDVMDWKVGAEHLVETEDGDRGRIDIFANGNIGSRHYQIAIEAKVGALEGKNQLEKYKTYMLTRSAKIQEKCDDDTIVVFLTQSGRSSRSLKSAMSISYADLLKIWLPVLKTHSKDPSASFVRLLFADIARDLADMHIGDQLSGRHGDLPRYVGIDSMSPDEEVDNE